MTRSGHRQMTGQAFSPRHATGCGSLLNRRAQAYVSTRPSSGLDPGVSHERFNAVHDWHGAEPRPGRRSAGRRPGRGRVAVRRGRRDRRPRRHPGSRPCRALGGPDPEHLRSASAHLGTQPSAQHSARRPPGACAAVCICSSHPNRWLTLGREYLPATPSLPSLAILRKPDPSLFRVWNNRLLGCNTTQTG